MSVHGLTDNSVSAISLLSELFLVFPPAAEDGLPFLGGPADDYERQERESSTTVDIKLL